MTSKTTEARDNAVTSWASEALPIPAHWVYADFDVAFDNISLNDIKIPQKEYRASGEFPIIDQGQDLIGGYTDDADKTIELQRASIVFGDHTRCFKYVPFTFAPGADGIKVLVPREPIIERFAYYACKSLRLPDRGYSRHYSFLRNSKFPLPPVAEQQRIVASLEGIFSELDSGIQDLKTARAQLKVYRRAVFQNAFEGKLTAQWREQNMEKLEEDPDRLLQCIQEEREARYQQQLLDWQAAVRSWEEANEDGKRPVKPKRQKDVPPPDQPALSNLAELPLGWKWVKLGELVWSVRDGPHFSPRYEESGIPFITGGNVRPDGIDFATAKFIAPELHRELSARCKPELGDVLYTKGGTTGIARVNTQQFPLARRVVGQGERAAAARTGRHSNPSPTRGDIETVG